VTQSYKVKSSYIDTLKTSSSLPPLLSLAFQFLGHSRGAPLPASRFSITSYTPSTAETPKGDAQHLMIHLYYLSLTHLPSLTKAWFLDLTHRQTVLGIETWTEKFISPLIIAQQLTTVTEWVASGYGDDAEPDSDAEAFKVKVSRTAKEVTASYDVDEQTMQIVIRLPPVYPLLQATVESIHRVGVDEKRWRSWLINTQGVIQFSVGHPQSAIRSAVVHVRGRTLRACCSFGLPLLLLLLLRDFAPPLLDEWLSNTDPLIERVPH
jgi:hypothetical protein